MDLYSITMGNSRNLEHAEHNEKAYRYLCQEPEFSDWIITTAFYSAIHYIRHRMFPFEDQLKNGKKIHFDKIQESPELLIGRPDEGIIYHFSNDAGFTMLNPPLNIK